MDGTPVPVIWGGLLCVVGAGIVPMLGLDWGELDSVGARGNEGAGAAAGALVRLATSCSEGMPLAPAATPLPPRAACGALKLLASSWVGAVLVALAVP